jgi:hypothetical protein
MYAELAGYLHSKRKAVELTGEAGGKVKTEGKFIVELVEAQPKVPEIRSDHLPPPPP